MRIYVVVDFGEYDPTNEYVGMDREKAEKVMNDSGTRSIEVWENSEKVEEE